MENNGTGGGTTNKVADKVAGQGKMDYIQKQVDEPYKDGDGVKIGDKEVARNRKMASGLTFVLDGERPLKSRNKKEIDAQKAKQITIYPW